MMASAEIVSLLNMQPHPEGGWYVETYRDNPTGGRGNSTAIYFLLERGQTSTWHRVHDAAEVWHFYAGDPLELTYEPVPGVIRTDLLGVDLAAGQRPQIVVPANGWQMARSTGDWTLVGCTVAPGFDFAAFELAPMGWQPDGR